MVYKTNINELKKVLRKHEQTKTPIFIYGGYGIGKSSLIKQFGKEKANEQKKEFIYWNETPEPQKKKVEASPERYYVIFDERLSQYEPTDLRGVPQMFDDKESD